MASFSKLTKPLLPDERLAGVFNDEDDPLHGEFFGGGVRGRSLGGRPMEAVTRELEAEKAITEKWLNTQKYNNRLRAAMNAEKASDPGRSIKDEQGPEWVKSMRRWLRGSTQEQEYRQREADQKAQEIRRDKVRRAEARGGHIMGGPNRFREDD